MQLTPRTLAMALGACIVGGLLLGIIGIVTPSLTSASASLSGTVAKKMPAADFGDVRVTYPSSSPLIDSSPVVHTESTPDAAPQPPTPTATPSFSAPPGTTVDSGASGLAFATTRAKPDPNGTPRGPRETSADPARPKSSDRTSQLPKPRTTALSPRAMNNWVAPKLGIGVTHIDAPRLSSGAKASVTVMCLPSSACEASGTALTISPAAQRVTVTWSVPAGEEWRAWSVTRTYIAAGSD